MAQQTAVEWFWSKIALRLSIEQVNEFLPELQKALEMEKEQIRNAIIWGTDIEAGLIDRNYKIQVEEQYYNETYGQERE